MHTSQGVAEPAHTQHNPIHASDPRHTEEMATVGDPIAIHAIERSNREVLAVLHTIERIRRHNGEVLASIHDQRDCQEAMQEEAEAHYANFAPLEKICPPGFCEQFMFMGAKDGIYRYKHIDTRRYLNVDVSGATYAYTPSTSSYAPISIAAAREALVQP